MSSVIFTSYFSSKQHPQLGDPHIEGVAGDGRVKQNDISYIQKWYDSVKGLGIEARIFHDNLTEEFVKQYGTDKINFVRVDSSDYSNNDWRFFCYRNYLEYNFFDSVFLSDSSDVTVVQDPAKILREFPYVDYFVCKDSIKLNQFPYLNLHQQVGWDDTVRYLLCQEKMELINMGVIGGRFIDMKIFLGEFCQARLKMGDPAFNADMWVGQYVFRSLLNEKEILIGEPFTSNFKKYEEDRKDVYFIHK